MSASPLTVAAHLAARGVPADRIADEACGDIADLIAAGLVTEREGVLIEASTGEPLDPFAPLPNPVVAVENAIAVATMDYHAAMDELDQQYLAAEDQDEAARRADDSHHEIERLNRMLDALTPAAPDPDPGPTP